MKWIAVIFVVLAMILGAVYLPLKHFDFESLARLTILCAGYYTVVWLIIYQIIYMGKKFKTNQVVLAMAGNIGFKFLASIALVALLFKTDLLPDVQHFALFGCYYIAYSILIGVGGNKLMGSLD